VNKRQARIFALYLAIEVLEMKCANAGLPHLMADSERNGEKIAKQLDNIITALSKRVEKLEGTGPLTGTGKEEEEARDE